MNLITDPWIPVHLKNGERHIIRPHEMADASIAEPDWPRPDLNVACLELLIGLIFIADPPSDDEDWETRQQPDIDRLGRKLLAIKDAFNLSGDGPRFMQDLEVLEGDANPPDMLFIDSAGANTAKNNADLMVRRERYAALNPHLAAIALFAFQAFAPSGGAGNRTSMRGGGPMTTLVDSEEGLWATVWANMPYGKAQDIKVLPWMRPTRVSDNNKPPTFPDNPNEVTAETFFGMPRRLRLVFDQTEQIIGVIQRPYGTNYTGWNHPLTPYYQMKEGSEWLPKHPTAGAFGYRNWLGIVAASIGENKLRHRAACVEIWQSRLRGRPTARLLVAGWAMDNMKPLDFVLSSQPLHVLADNQSLFLGAMIGAAEIFSNALRSALQTVFADGESRDARREEFYLETQGPFEDCVAALCGGETTQSIAIRWRDHMRNVARKIFDEAALPALTERRPEEIERIVEASRFLNATLNGATKQGAKAYGELGLPPYEKKKSQEAA